MRKKRLTERFVLKVFAYFMTVILFFGTVAGIVGIVAMAEEGFYEKRMDKLIESGLSDIAWRKGIDILSMLSDDMEEYAERYCEDTNLQYQVLDEQGTYQAGNYNGRSLNYVYNIYAREDAPLLLVMDTGSETTSHVVDSRSHTSFMGEGWVMKLYVDKSFFYEDEFSKMFEIYIQLYSVRYYLIGLTVVMGILCIISFIFQLCSAGRRYGEEEVRAKGIAAIPFDLLSVGAVVIVILLWEGFFDHFYWHSLSETILAVVLLVAGFAAAVGYCIIWAIQVKAGTWWKNMLICQILRGITAGCRFCIRGMTAVFRNLPNLVQALIGLGGLFIAEMVVLALLGMLYLPITGALAIIWFLEKIILIPVVLYFALINSKLAEGGRRLADGELDYQIDTGRMFGNLKEQGENLNRIGEGLNVAVEERMKSERLKTELITNVSHDIKTPLTSIINYADLIVEEPTENARITEYAEVLKRQSARLKKLIEDLMEASKASTGNIEVHMVPCEVGVLLTQTMGEYEQRLAELGLELVARQPDHPVRIMADGKLLWRVFDNLLNNICKYAMGGTRVYLTVEERDGKVAIAFKNISKYPLDISAEELKERFVRGDRSRHTEGNGLGLSITQSLTQLQGGELELTVDGDFFKVVLVFEGIE